VEVKPDFGVVQPVADFCLHLLFLQVKQKGFSINIAFEQRLYPSG
jgi:hypothetical protein